MDLATRLLQLPRTLRLESQHPSVLADIVRAAHETLEPHRVAGWLAHQLQAWLPLASWAVLEDDLMGPPKVLARVCAAGLLARGHSDDVRSLVFSGVAGVLCRGGRAKHAPAARSPQGI